MLTPEKIARMIDLSCVQAYSTEDDIHQVAKTAKQYGCICVYALPAHTPLLVELVNDRPDILVGGTPGFPHGAATTEAKAAETRALLKMGCGEFDTVINIGWLKAGKDERVRDDLAAVIEAAEGKPVEVIAECHYLTNDEIVRACELSVEAGAAFVKTGTGWAPTGATFENVSLMLRTVGGRCEVKAAGGVRGLETLLAMHRLGATRFGIRLSTAVEILERVAGLSPQAFETC